MISVKDLNSLLLANFNQVDINGREGFNFTIDEVSKLKDLLVVNLLRSLQDNVEPVAYIDSMISNYPSCIKKLSYQSESEKLINKLWFPVFAATANIEDIIKDFRKENEYLQSKIDELMLEYCPDEMTEEQLNNWKKHQKIVEL